MHAEGSVRRILSFRDLDVWQQSMRLAEMCYTATRQLPSSEAFGLAAQIRRAAVSVPSNIAEGHQLTRAAYRRHVTIALGSLAELQTQVDLARRVDCLHAEAAEEVDRHSERVRQMLVRLRAALGRCPP